MRSKIAIEFTKDELEVIQFMIKNRHSIPDWITFTSDKETYIRMKVTDALDRLKREMDNGK